MNRSVEVGFYYMETGSYKDVPSLLDLVGPEEAKQAGGFGSETRKQEFLLGRALVRRLVSGLTGTSPRSISITLTGKGKPILKTGPSDRNLDFSLSHCPGMVACALAQRPLGVDVENRSRRVNLKVADRFFSASENRLIRNAGPDTDARNEIFLKIWTLKEAYVKAMGKGLSIPLHTFSLDPFQDPIQVWSAPWHKGPCPDWLFFSFTPAVSYRAATSVFVRPGEQIRLNIFRCTLDEEPMCEQVLHGSIPRPVSGRTWTPPRIRPFV